MHFEWSEVPSMLGTLILALLGLNGGSLTIAVLTKLPALTTHFYEWSKTQAAGVKSAYAAQLMQRVLGIVHIVVVKAENTWIEEIKEALKDGTLTKDELKTALTNVKTKVLAEIQSHIAAQGIGALLMTVFLGNQDAFDKWLDAAVEAEVAKLPASGVQTSNGKGLPAVAVAAPTPPSGSHAVVPSP